MRKAKKEVDRSQSKLTLTRKMRKEKAKDTGITLMALVITIIILLILASISLGTVTTDNGVLKYAFTTKDELQNATRAEDKATNEIKDTVPKNNPRKEDEEEYTWTIRNTRNFEVPYTGWYYIDAYGAKGGDWSSTTAWSLSDGTHGTATGGKGGIVSAKIYLKEGDIINIENGQYGGARLANDQEPGGQGGARAAVGINGTSIMVAGGGGGATSGGGYVFWPDSSYGELQPKNGGDGGLILNGSVDENHSSDAQGVNETPYTDDGWHNVGGGGGGYYGGNSGERYRKYSYSVRLYLTDYYGFTKRQDGYGGTISLPIVGYEGRVRKENGNPPANWEQYGHWNGIIWYYAWSSTWVDEHQWVFEKLSRTETGDDYPEIGLKDTRAFGTTNVYKQNVNWPVAFDGPERRYHFDDDLYGKFDYSAQTSGDSTTRLSNASYGGTSYYNAGYSVNGQVAKFGAKAGANTETSSKVVITVADKADDRPINLSSEDEDSKTVNIASRARTQERSNDEKKENEQSNKGEETKLLLKKYVDELGNVILKENEGKDYSLLMFSKNVRVSDMLPKEETKSDGSKITIQHGIVNISGYTFKNIKIDENVVKEFHPRGYTDINNIYHKYKDNQDVKFVYVKNEN